MVGVKYAKDPEWADITPIEQDDGGPEALALIAYTDEYREAISYLRGIISRNEHSPRVLSLTAHIISLNPAHYTVWLYRAKTLLALYAGPDSTSERRSSTSVTDPAPASITPASDPSERAEGASISPRLQEALRMEIEWLNSVSLRHIKNYQIWHHRQSLLNLLNDPSGEADFLTEMLDKDAKNYHVWSYRQWMVGHFGLWDDPQEWEEVERRLRWDVRNNSAWNHRWFLVFGHFGQGGERDISDEKWSDEVEYAKEKIRIAPQNESPWNYLRALLRVRNKSCGSMAEFAEKFANVHAQTVSSSYALDLLADAYAERDVEREKAEKALDLLANKYDPIRAKYWHYRKKLLLTPTSLQETEA